MMFVANAIDSGCKKKGKIAKIIISFFYTLMCPPQPIQYFNTELDAIQQRGEKPGVKAASAIRWT